MPARGRLRVLLSEGSSLTSREFISALGPAGHELDVMDPDPLCLARFSRWVCRVIRCPAVGADPFGYVDAVQSTLGGAAEIAQGAVAAYSLSPEAVRAIG